MNRTYKLTPVNQYDIAALESWLEDMATRGLYLKKFRPLFCTFVKGVPRKTRYRLEPHHRPMDTDLPQSMLELYQDFGWDCVDEINRSMLVFSTQNMHAQELHTDPELQSGQWRKLRKSMLGELLINFILLCVLVALDFINIFEAGTPILNLVVSLNLPVLVFTVYLIIAEIGLFRSFLQVNQQTRSLSGGTPLKHRRPYRNRSLSGLVSFLIVCLCLILILGGRAMNLKNQSASDLNQFDAFPILILSDIEEALRNEPYLSFFRTYHYILCPDMWKVSQLALDDEKKFFPNLFIDRYDLLIPALAKPVALDLLRTVPNNSLLEDYDYPPLQPLIEYAYPGLDYLALARRGDNFTVAVAVRGRSVVCARYTGQGNLEEHFDQIAAMVGG